MSDDNQIRMAICLLVAVFVPPALYYRLRSKTRERLDRWQEGALILFGLRFSALISFLGVVAWMSDPNLLAWSSIGIPMVVRWMAVACFVGGGMLAIWTFHNLGRNLTDSVVTRAEHSLIVTGPYRFVRHPFYVAMTLGILGGSLAISNWLILISGLVPLGFIVARTRIEEAKLIDRFGDDYRAYMQRVGRFIPTVRREPQ